MPSPRAHERGEFYSEARGHACTRARRSPRAPALCLSVCLSSYLSIHAPIFDYSRERSLSAGAAGSSITSKSSAATLPTVTLNEIETPQSLDNVRD